MTPAEGARRALSASEVIPASPMAAATARARAWAGAPLEASKLIATWQTRQPGSNIGSTRYRWDVSHYRCKVPAYAGDPQTWRAWRPAEQPEVDRDLYKFEERLLLPIMIAEACEFLAEHGDAKDLFYEAEPIFRRDVATHALLAHAYFDTLAIFTVARLPRALEALRPVLFALTTVYADEARRAGGMVLGTRFPFHEKPQVSSTAQLARGLLALGLELPLLAELAQFVRKEQRASGAWGDASGPDDVFTTFVALDSTARLDPTFDAMKGAQALATFQQKDGFFRAFGAEAAWLTAGAAQLIVDCEKPFDQRFQFPHVPAVALDRKTQLPFYAYFDDIARLFETLPGLAASDVEMVFMDLAGFRAFNNAFGQDMGDDVLAAFAAELAKVPFARAIRDGGDEFLLVSAPTHRGLAAAADAFRRAWPTVFRERFGDEAPPVAPRILVTQTKGGELRKTRERLGKEVGSLKAASKDVPPEGVMRVLG